MRGGPGGGFGIGPGGMDGIWDLGFGIQLLAPSSLPTPALPPSRPSRDSAFSPPSRTIKKRGDLLQETRTAGRGWRTTGRARGRRGEGFVEGDSGMGQPR